MKIEKNECNYQVTECDLKFGRQITLDGELLIPVSVLYNIKDEIEEIEINGNIRDVECFSAGINAALKIIDKYGAESEK